MLNLNMFYYYGGMMEKLMDQDIFRKALEMQLKEKVQSSSI